MIRFCGFADEASADMKEQIEALKRNGFSFLEIRGVDGVNISEITKEKAKEVRTMLDDAGLAVWSMGSPIGKITLNDDFAKHLDLYKRILEYADILGASKIRMFSFYPVEGLSYEETQAKVFERLNAFCDVTPDGIMMCHENEKEIFGESAENCLAIHKAFPKIRAVFDPANFVQSGVDTLKAWELLHPYVAYFHVKDALADQTVVPAGEGIGNLPTLLKQYIAGGGEVLTLEPHLAVFPGFEKLENGASLKEEITYYQSGHDAFDAAANALKKLL